MEMNPTILRKFEEQGNLKFNVKESQCYNVLVRITILRNYHYHFLDS